MTLVLSNKLSVPQRGKLTNIIRLMQKILISLQKKDNLCQGRCFREQGIAINLIQAKFLFNKQNWSTCSVLSIGPRGKNTNKYLTFIKCFL